MTNQEKILDHIRDLTKPTPEGYEVYDEKIENLKLAIRDLALLVTELIVRVRVHDAATLVDQLKVLIRELPTGQGWDDASEGTTLRSDLTELTSAVNKLAGIVMDMIPSKDV